MTVNQRLPLSPAFTIEAWVGEPNYWNHLSIVHEAGQVKHYINGIVIPESESLNDPLFLWLRRVEAYKLSA